MLFEEKDSKALKAYLLTLLDPISNADLDILSDYILALLRHDQSVEDVKKLCLSQLDEFLRENTFSFVQDIFDALERKTYLNENMLEKESSVVEKYKESTRKRSFHQTSLDARIHGINNEKKSRFGKSFRVNNRGNWRSFRQKAPFSDMFSFSPDFPINSTQRCRDYEERGYCMRGDMCFYDHGIDHIVMDGQYSDAYDPTQSIHTNHSVAITHSGLNYKNTLRNDKEHFRKHKKNNSCLIKGPNYNQTITTLIIENIPNSDLNEENIRFFFKKFGEISKIIVKKAEHRAILKFKDWESANKAWSSSAPIFNNRFVKLYWHSSKSNDRNDLQENNMALDTSEKHVVDGLPKDKFMEKIEKKQKEYEEREQRKKQNAKEREMLLEKEELIQKQLEEKRNLIALMSKKDTNIPEFPQKEDYDINKLEPSALSRKALETQLASLKAEANNLGISINTKSLNTSGNSGNKKKLGFSRSFSKVFRHSSGKNTLRRGSMQLDNRTRKIAVYNLDPDKDEVLRQHLLHNGEYEAIEKDVDDSNVQIIVFKDRWTAEKFLRNVSTIPDMENVKLKWKYDTTKNSGNILDHNLTELKEARNSDGRGFYDDDDDVDEALWRR
ncbi:hypothetical protein PNEG_01691 [Pneumocystis murina B123]|uniref:C3H1-type domain-containing protein n=1 Tax=Pneumocystis murina (strain B123) TaxID=1069680 RepID=M7NRM9_PNEMU|nr:hypothetical protein PNEG_01691 [Pneumocystis murina B123]EMR09932.1 hypothetical protein PNEG_01691 [Pneumocystis murina B123]